MEDLQPLRNGSAHDSSGESDSEGQVSKEEEEEKDREEECEQSLIRGPWCCKQAKVTSSSESPRDKLFLVYLCLFLTGMGVLFPWNSFVSALDYFLFLYRSYHPEVAIPLTYLIITLAAMGFTISTVNLFPLHGRIGFGYVMFFITLLFIPLLDIGIHNCTVSSTAGFFLTLSGVVLVGVGSGGWCTQELNFNPLSLTPPVSLPPSHPPSVQQSSLYGLAGILPGKHYTQALMAGESAAGITVALNRVVTKAAVSEERIGAIVFFVMCLLFIVLCVCCQVFLCFSPFVRFHLKHFQAAKRTEKQVT